MRTSATGQLADHAHVRWLLNMENLEFAWSDPMNSGIAKGSHDDPRGVTALLWLDELSSTLSRKGRVR